MAENIIKTNPAARLNEILWKAKKIYPVEGQNETVMYRDAWCRVFEIKPHNTEKALIEVLHRLLELRQLFAVTQEALQVMKADEELYIQPVKNASTIVSDLNAINKRWGEYVTYLADTTMTSLKFVEHFLSGRPEIEEVKIPKEEIDTILSDVNDLYNLILNSKLPLELRDDLLDLLEEMIQAMREYHIRGAVRIKEAIAKSIGVLAVNKDAVAENKDSQELKQLLKLLDRVDNIYSSATKVQPLLQAASSVLPLLLGGTK